MSTYFIAIGGTGVRILESLVHLAGAGLLWDADSDTRVNELKVIIVDPDKSNGCIKRVQEHTIARYMEAVSAKIPGSPEIPFLQTRITLQDPWSPLSVVAANLPENQRKLDKVMKIETPRNAAAGLVDPAQKMQARGISDIMDVLYTENEKTQPLNEGFRGHPSIGAAVFANSINFANNQIWRSLGNDLRPQSGSPTISRIMLSGSVFGGTGAAGLPTMAELLNHLINAADASTTTAIGGLFMLPYFSFPPPPDPKEMTKEEKEKNKIFADPKLFPLNTKAAILDYYNAFRKIESFRAAYFLGYDQDRWAEMPNHRAGAQEQNNPPCWIELMGATSALHFFRKSDVPEGRYATAIKDDNIMRWEDLNDGIDTNKVSQRLGQMARFCFAYLDTYYPVLLELKKNPKRGYRAPWYINFFERKNASLDGALPALRKVAEYAEDFLKWAATIQGEPQTAHLFQREAFASYNQDSLEAVVKMRADTDGHRYGEFDHARFERLIHNHESKSMWQLWENMCTSQPGFRYGDGMQGFIRALFTHCKI